MSVAEPGGLVDSLLKRCDFPRAGGGEVGGRVSLAVSGGADSLALLVLATAAGLPVVAIHVDHGLRTGSGAEAETVANAASRYGAAFEARAVHLPPGGDVEARARAARYGALPPGVMTGHTMDDQAETVLLNLVRGAGLDGLSGMRNPGVLRPLLRLRRGDTEALCESEGLDPVRDPTNDDPTFLRNRIRHEVIPLLCDVAGRDVVPVLARQADLLCEEADLLDHLAGGLDPEDARRIRDAPRPLARRALRRWLRSSDRGGDSEEHPPSAAEIGRVLAVAEGLVTACELAGGRRVSRRAGRLSIHPGSEPNGR